MITERMFQITQQSQANARLKQKYRPKKKNSVSGPYMNQQILKLIVLDYPRDYSVSKKPLAFPIQL